MTASTHSSHYDIRPRRNALRWLLGIEGAVLALAGIAALAFPLFATLATTIFLGWILLASGVAGAIGAVSAQGRRSLVWSLSSAAAALITGFVLLCSPIVGAQSLVLLIGAYLLVRVWSLFMSARDHRRRGDRHWWTMLLGAVVDFALAVLLILVAPLNAMLMVGIVVGIDLVIGGLALIVLASGLRRSA